MDIEAKRILKQVRVAARKRQSKLRFAAYKQMGSKKAFKQYY